MWTKNRSEGEGTRWEQSMNEEVIENQMMEEFIGHSRIGGFILKTSSKLKVLNKAARGTL